MKNATYVVRVGSEWTHARGECVEVTENSEGVKYLRIKLPQITTWFKETELLMVEEP